MPDVAGKIYTDASHFANNQNFEVQRSNHFEVILNLNNVFNAEGTGPTISEHIRLSTKQITAPKISSEALELKHGNDRVKVAAAPQYEDLTITVYDTIGKDQVDVLQSWYSKVFDYKTKLMGMVSDYKTDGILYMYSPDCKKLRKWVIEGVWPRSFGMGTDFSFDSAEAMTVTLELSVDRYHEEAVADN